MFSVIISEKGGAERRETFDRTEINVGRVQGNDLMLPKGNVSKRHARLLYRDGRFIVTDLKSTNGTYVNGRKIAQATIVREGDKIYIGDFVLRIEASPSVAAPDSTAPPRITGDGEAHDGPDEAPPPPPRPTPHPELSALGPPSSAEKGLAPRPPPRIDEKFEGTRTGGQVVSHFPLENDPDESAPEAVVPGPPRVPSPRPVISPVTPNDPRALRASEPRPAAEPSATGSVPPLSPPSPPGPVAMGPTAPIPSLVIPSAPAPASPPVTPPVAPVTPVAPVVPRTSSSPTLQAQVPLARQAGVGASPAAHLTSTSTNTSALPPARRAIPPASERSPEAPQSAAHARALLRLIQRVGEAIDLRLLDAGAPVEGALERRIEQRLVEAAAAMQAAGELPAEVNQEALLGDARRELLQLGPLDPLLAEE
ncbi:MAG: FHA domain-containing protein, partial [Polyangiaceae bacterium]|nr:FHA domain-containing protein [Polyangiaceae bacterium]